MVDGVSSESRDQLDQVQAVLEEIEAGDIPQITVFNKIDLNGEPARLERDAAGRVTRVWLSAQTGAGVDLLRQALAEYYRRNRLTQHLRLPTTAGRLRALIYEHLSVRRETISAEGEWRLEIELSPPDLAWLISLPDFRPEQMLEAEDCVLARTGS